MLRGRNVPITYWPEASILFLWNASFLIYLLHSSGTSGSTTRVDNLALILGPALSFLFCVNRCRQSWKGFLQASTTQKWSFVLLCCYLLLFVIGACLRAYAASILQVSQFSISSAEIVWLISYGALLGSIMLLPRHSWEISSYLRVILDGLMIMISVISFSWYFVLGPAILASNQTILSKILITAFPLCDLLLFYCLLSFRSVDESLKSVLGFLAVGLIAIMTADSLFDHQALEGNYVSSGLVGFGWMLGSMLIGLAALALLRACTSSVSDENEVEANYEFLEVPRLWRALFPYSLVPLVAILIITIYSQSYGSHALKTGVYIVGIILVGVILLRQIFHVRETISYAQTAVRLNNELQATYEELSKKNEALSQANQRLEGLLTTDHVTGLANHRALVQMLDLEVARSRRHKHVFTVVFANLDHFKAINDSYGYAVGDSILHELALLLVKTLRTSDIVGRWGGEEFFAILPETGAESALIAARRLCTAIAEHSFATEKEIRLTCSLGIATFPGDGSERNHLISGANNAMLMAKKLGRNQFRIASETNTVVDDKQIDESGSHNDELLNETVKTLTQFLEEHDRSREKHSQQLASYATKLALQLGLDTTQAHLIGLAGRLYDIGKVAVPEAVLLKKEPLTENEWEIIRQHPLIGANMLSSVPVPALCAIAPIVRAHHERIDGKGYPDGLLGEAIPLGARIIAVIDAFDAMITNRSYQDAHDPVWALEELRRNAGTQFDFQVVAAFEHIINQERQSAVKEEKDETIKAL